MLKKFFSKKDDNPEKGQDSYEHSNQKGKIVIKSKKKNPNPTTPVKSGSPGTGQNPMYAEDIIKSFENQANHRRQIDQEVASDNSAAQQSEIQELQDDLDALRQASDELRTELASAHQENIELKQTLKDKTSELEQFSQKLEENSNTSSDSESSEQQSAIEELKLQNEDAQTENLALKTQIETLNEQLELAQSNFSKLQEGIEKASGQKASSEKELENELKTSLKNLENKDSEIKKLYKEIEKFKIDLDQETQSSEDIQAKLIEAEKMSAKVTKEAEKKDAKFKQLNDQFQIFKNATKETGGIQKELETEIEKLQKVVSSWEEKSSKWSADLVKSEEVLKKSNAAINELKSNAAVLEDEVNSLVQKEKSLLEEQDELKSTVGVLEDEKKEFTIQIKQLEKDKISVEKERADLLASMQNIKSGNADQQSALDLSNKELKKAAEEKVMLDAKLKAGADQLAENSKKIKQLERAINKSTKLNEDLQSQLNHTEKGQKSLESDIKKLSDQLSQSEALRAESEKSTEQFRHALEKLETDNKDIQAKKEKVLEELKSKWKSEKSEFEKQIELLSGDADAKYEQLENDIIEWKHKGESDAKTIQNLSKAKSDLEDEIKDFDTKILALENDQKSLNSDWDKEKASLEKDIANYVDKEKQLNDHLNKIEKEKEGAVSALDQANEKNEALQKEMESVQKSLEAAHEDNDEVKTLEKEINKITTERDGLAVAISDFEERIEKYEAEAKLSLEKIDILNTEVANLTEQISSAESAPPEAMSSAAPESTETRSEIEGDYNIVVRIMPDADEFEVELPAAFTGAEIISELMEAGVLSEETSYELLIERTGDYIGGDETLFDSPVEENEVVIIR